MSTENFQHLISTKSYLRLYKELSAYHSESTTSDLIYEGLEYLDARLCRLLIKMGEKIVTRITDLQLEKEIVLLIGNEKEDLIIQILDEIEKKEEISVETLSRSIFDFKEKIKEKTQLKTEKILVNAFDRYSLSHVAAKADQFGEITKKEKSLLLNISNFVIPKKEFRSFKQMKFFKDTIVKLFKSNVTSKPCGDQDKPCKRCLDIDKSLKKLSENGELELEQK